MTKIFAEAIWSNVDSMISKSFPVSKKSGLQEALATFLCSIHSINTILPVHYIDCLQNYLSANTNIIFVIFCGQHSNILSWYCHLLLRHNLMLAWHIDLTLARENLRINLKGLSHWLISIFSLVLCGYFSTFVVAMFAQHFGCSTTSSNLFPENIEYYV